MPEEKQNPADAMCRIAFVRIVWMKNYEGITPDDRPRSMGELIPEEKAGNDVFQFSKYDGHCYGYVGGTDQITLPPALSPEDEQDGDDIVSRGWKIIFCAGKEKRSLRIVGWYNNATLYTREQYRPCFTNPDYELDYFFETRAEDAVLLPESARRFVLGHAPGRKEPEEVFRKGSSIRFVAGTGKRPDWCIAAEDFLADSTGARAVSSRRDKPTCALPEEGTEASAESLLEKSMHCMREDNYEAALTLARASLNLRVTPEGKYAEAYSLYCLTEFSEALKVLEEYEALSPGARNGRELKAFCLDMTGRHPECLRVLEKLLGETDEGEEKEELARLADEIRAYLQEEPDSDAQTD